MRLREAPLPTLALWRENAVRRLQRARGWQTYSTQGFIASIDRELARRKHDDAVSPGLASG